MDSNNATHIGEILAFDSTSFDNYKSAFARALSFVHGAADFYKSLNIGDFDAGVLNQILSGNADEIKAQYKEAVESSLNSQNLHIKAMTDSFYANVDKDMDQLNNIVQIGKQEVEGIDPAYKTLVKNALASLTVVKGAILTDPAADESAKKSFQKIIENQEQSNVYQLYLNAKEALQALKEGIDGYASFTPGTALVTQQSSSILSLDSDNDLQLNIDFLTSLN